MNRHSQGLKNDLTLIKLLFIDAYKIVRSCDNTFLIIYGINLPIL
jgi:hypothetical protein